MIKNKFDEYLQNLYAKQLLNRKVRFLYDNHLDELELINDILNAKISGQIVAFLQMYQLHPERWKSIIDKNKQWVAHVPFDSRIEYLEPTISRNF